LDLVYSGPDLILSVSLCYAAFDFADMAVQIWSDTNRTETAFDNTYDATTLIYTFAALRQAMGQDDSTSISDRGQLQLASKSSWLTDREGVSQTLAGRASFNPELYLRSFADIGFGSKQYITDPNVGNISGVILSGASCPEASPADADCATPNRMHIWLIQEILRTGGSIAFAMQTMITLLSSMTYYDQMGQFDKSTAANITLFQIASVPVAYRGFVIVMVMLGIHFVTLATIVLLFLRRTFFSRLGACWSTLAKVGAGDVAEHLRYSTLLSDDQVQKEMQRHAVGHDKVQLEEVGEGAVFTHG
jgi:hypothetical protein